MTLPSTDDLRKLRDYSELVMRLQGLEVCYQYAGDAADAIAALEGENKLLREALERADQFISNGIELGFIRMPDPSTPDPAHDTPEIIRAALSQTENTHD